MSTPGGHPAPRHGRPRTRLRLYRNPLRLAVSASTWRAAWLPGRLRVRRGLAAVRHRLHRDGTAAVFLSRWPGSRCWSRLGGAARLRQRRTGPAAAGAGRAGPRRLPPVPRRGILAQVRTRWRDPATWRDFAYLVGLWPLLFVLDTAVLSVWLMLLAGVTLPAWYWAPRGPRLGYTRPRRTRHARSATSRTARTGPAPGASSWTPCPRRCWPRPLPGRVPDLQLRARGDRAGARPGRRAPCCARPPTRWPRSRRCSPSPGPLGPLHPAR